ncbi:MAG: hypothetical protein GWO41_09215 [candidate division Zixibacteria bacterium]|nr:hypothetical protein [candidate division Zixibacteria bacterium]NIR67558.1 hypothetical protein [candidate division Zixibacteria bacterium]NIS16528.1 hypothetical protein [candidate division Zixibacteria bacterium]NIS48818.1 hypothetical protein [candidate division Zixibacteria bacterium]NIT52897.1 hypothetical protein [candidate division Zixibacteria bacterium]
MMSRYLVSAFIILTALIAVTNSQDAESLSAAQALSQQSGKPILLEFVRSD